MKVLWHIWDGAAAWIVDALIERWTLPVVAGLRADGQWGSAEAPRPNCQTPTGLATLLTGTPPAVHGIAGFWVPGPDASTRKTPIRGFTEGLRRAETLWERDGFDSTMISAHVPWVIAADGSVPRSTVVASDALNARIAYEGFVALPDRGDAELPFADEGSPDAVVTCRSDGTIHLAEGGRTVLLGDRWHPVWAANGNGRWYRTARNESGALVVVRSAMWQTRVEGSPEVVERARRMEREIGPFLGDGMGSLYRSGIFGRRLIDGGSGDAERILLEAAEIVVRTMWGPLDVRGRSVGVLSRTAVPQPELRTVAAW